jgi:hypothetical protein
MATRYSMLRISTLLLSAGLLSSPAFAGLTTIPIGSLAETTPTIDGTLSPGEWTDAACASETAIADDASAQAVTVCVKNDAANLYMSVEIDGADYGDALYCHDFIRILFDNANNGVAEVGENMWAVRFDGAIANDGFTKLGGTYQFGSDTSFSGSNDLTAAISHSNPVANGFGTYTIEFAAPLDSADDAHDFSLVPGDSLGYSVHMADGDPSPVPTCPSGVGSFFLPSVNPSVGGGFAQIDIVEPGVIIDTDTTGNFELLPGDLLIIRNGATVTGNITVDGGNLVLTGGGIIDGDILGSAGGDIDILDGSVVTGDLIHSGGILTVAGSTIFGSMLRDNSTLSLVTNSSIGGDVRFVASPHVSFENSDIGGDLVIGMSPGPGFDTRIFALLSNVDVANGILIDVTGGGIVTEEFEIALASVGAGNNILIDVTGAGLQTDDFTVSLIDATAGNNILIDITGAGIDAVNSTLSLVASNIDTNVLIDVTAGGISPQVSSSTIGKHLQIKGAVGPVVTGNTIGKHLQLKGSSGVCTISGNNVGGKIKARGCN